jgi:hypothetical protein
VIDQHAEALDLGLEHAAAEERETVVAPLRVILGFVGAVG